MMQEVIPAISTKKDEEGPELYKFLPEIVENANITAYMRKRSYVFSG